MTVMATLRPDKERPASPRTTLAWTEPVWLTLRADLRRKWRAMLGLALLLGLISGVVLTAAAGAQRTSTAYPRLLAWANASQLAAIPAINFHVPTDYYEALARQPQVASLATAVLYQAALPAAGPTATSQLNVMSSPDHALGVSVDKVKVLSGRMFDPGTPDQAVIDPRLAALEHVGPGGRLRLLAVPNAPGTSNPDPAKAVPVSFLVTAVVMFDNQVVPYGGANGIAVGAPSALLSSFPVPGAATSMSYGNEAVVRLRPGASVMAFTAAADALAARYKDTAGQVLVNTDAAQVTATERAIRPQAIALGAFAALAGLIAFAVLGQLLGRQLAVDAAEFPVLRALGMPRGALVALSLARLAVVTVAGGIVAVVVAIAASPLMPVGPARLAEPDPGIDVNIALLGAGFAVIALAPLAVLGGSAWRTARQTGAPAGAAEPASASSRPSGLRQALHGAGSVTGGLGAAMAFEPGHGRTAVPVRSALAGSVIALAALTAAAVFGASLIDLVSTPRLYGQNWDAQLDLGYGGVPGIFGAKVMTAAGPSVAGYAAGNYGQLTIGDEVVPAIGLDQGTASPEGGSPEAPGQQAGYLTVLAGRVPAAADEIAFGAQTLRAIGGHLGETLLVTVDKLSSNTAVRRTMRIVGVVVLPNFGRGTFTPTDLGNGAVVTAAVLSERSAPNNETLCTTSATCYNFFLLRYRPGSDAAAVAARLTAAAQAGGCPPGQCPVISEQRPGEIENYASVRDTPLALAAVLIVLAVGSLAYVLLTTVRRRRRDLAVLKVLGLTRPQVRGVVAWQASTFAAVALLLGLPLGVLAGRLAWAVFAHDAGVPAAPDVPLDWVLLAIPATVALANLIAAWPGWRAARLRPAAVLRAE
jgi:ABC-type antimicrobial peptide transport system permease subunit